MSICICLSQVLVGPFRGQPCQAPVCKHILGPAIVQGFVVCAWDRSLGGAVSGSPFLQSLLHFFFFFFCFCPCIFFKHGQFLVKIVEMGGWPHLSTEDCAYILEMVSSSSISLLLGILTNVISIWCWEPLESLVFGTF